MVTAEVVSALARRARAGEAGADQAVLDFVEMPLLRHPSHPLVATAWKRRSSLRVTDALYVELARTLGLPLVTSDARLGRAVQQQALCEVVVID